MTRKSVFTTAIAVLFLLLSSGSALAIYSWVDEQGQTHITDYPKPRNTAARPSPDDGEQEEAVPAPPRAPYDWEQPSSGTAVRPEVAVAPEPQTFEETANDTPGRNVAALSEQAGLVIAGTFASIILVSILLGYVYFSLCIYFIARRLNVENAWIAWVPLVQIIPLVAAASRPLWWVLLFFIPLVNLVVQTYIWMCISENLGRDKWLGLLTLVPLANVVYIGMLAFSQQDGGRREIGVSPA